MNHELESIIKSILEHGKCSTSFFSSYPGFRYFYYDTHATKILITYVETKTAWVGASEPLGDENHHLAAIQAFFEAAKRCGKCAVILPTSQALATQARGIGLGAIQIGKEPWFSLSDFQKPKIARQLEARGAIAESFNPGKIASRERLELESVTQAWLDSRKSAQLAFLNQVRPWIQMQHKRYFRVVHNGHQCGYLAAIPIPKINAWYLVDLIRSPVAPLGTTELLISKAAIALSAEGAASFTLGMSPLAPIDLNEKKFHPLIYSLFSLTFQKLSILYNFKTLYQFKEKMKPSSWAPLYLISSSPHLGPRAFSGIFNAIYTTGAMKTLLNTSSRIAKRILSGPSLSQFLSHRLVFRSKPHHFIEYCTRMKVTLALFATNILFFFSSTTENFNLREAARQRLGFQILKLIQGPDSTDFRSLFLHSFFHLDLTHLIFNMVCLVLFVGFLETIMGSTLALTSYAVGILFTNPLTSLILEPLLRIISHPLAERLIREEDVGCSLGVFAGIGSLAFFLKKPSYMISAFVLGTVAFSVTNSSVLAFNHLTALAIGYFISYAYVKRDHL